MIRLALFIPLFGACVKDVRPTTLPAPLPASEFSLPTVVERQLSNGIPVRFVVNHEVPLFEVRLNLRTGGWADPIGKEGTAAASFAMLEHGANGKSASEIAASARKIGATVSTYATTDASVVTISGLSKNADASLDLWTSILLHPDFPTSEWDVLRDQWIANLESERQTPTSMASRVNNRLLYADSYRGRLRTTEAYRSITTDDLRTFYQSALSFDSSTALITVAGDVDPEEWTAKLESRLASWTATVPSQPLILDPNQFGHWNKDTLYLIDRPGAAQSVLRVSTFVLTPGDSDFLAASVANEAIGGSFTGRINMNLREDKGYSYGARCDFDYRLGPSFWGCSTGVQADATAPALIELRREIIESLSSRPITEEETARFREAMIRSYNASFERSDRLVELETDVWLYKLPSDWITHYSDQISKTSTDSVNTAFQRYISPDKLLWVVVGDAARIRSSLEPLGFQIIELDPDGKPVSGE